jgi:hypothetical protein
MHALAPSTPIAPLTETIVALHHLHSLIKFDFPPIVNDFHPKIDLALDRKHLFIL